MTTQPAHFVVSTVKVLSIIILVFYSTVVFTQQGDSILLKQVFTTPRLRTEFAQFLDNVLRQFSSKQFFTLFNKLQHQKPLETDQYIYSEIVHNIHTIQPRVPLYYQLKSLAHQKKILSQQAQHLLKGKKNINGYLEIGTPGTYYTSIQQFLRRDSMLYILNDKKRLSDITQSDPRIIVYQRFVPLHSYAKIEESDIPSNSIDLIVCFIGLHHVPQEQLADFVSSLNRILRPGGILLLREHDAQDVHVKSIIHAAHSIYNAAITKETVQVECTEYRNFQPLSYWIQLCQSHGFSIGPDRLVQNGDPTLNTMFICTKIAHLPEDHISQVLREVHEQPNYMRDITQTYLSAPEWFNVDVAKEYGTFIEHTPFYEFPYFSTIQTYWHIFLKSWKAAAARKGNLHVLKSPYTLMNLFVGATMTVEHGTKGIISLPIRWMYSGEEPRTIQLLVQDSDNSLTSLDPHITILKQYPTSNATLIEVPRYKAFLHILYKLAQAGISCVEIAGQKEIQVKIRITLHEYTTSFQVPEGCTKEYEWCLPTQPNYKYMALTVPVPILTNSIAQLHAQKVEILYVHDY